MNLVTDRCIVSMVCKKVQTAVVRTAVDTGRAHDVAIGEPSPYGVVFWLVSAVRGTALLFGGGILTLSSVFAYSQIQADGFSWAAVGNSVLSAVVWSIIALVGTCYFSIPMAALVTGGVRMVIREIGQVRRRRYVVAHGGRP